MQQTQEPDIDNMSQEELDAYFAKLETLDQPTGEGVADELSELGEGKPDDQDDEPAGEEPVAEPVAQVPAAISVDAKTLGLIQSLQARIADLEKAPKNKVEGKPAAGKIYERLAEFTGKGPQQQRDLAAIITKEFPIGKPFTEAELFAALEKHQGEYYKLATSVQTVTYLFKYYRGIKEGGFLTRGFLKSN